MICNSGLLIGNSGLQIGNSGLQIGNSGLQIGVFWYLQFSQKTNKKFVNRFKKMESAINNEGKELNAMNLNEMNQYWEAAKNS